MLRLSIVLLFLVLSSNASALTFKSGENISSTPTSNIPEKSQLAALSAKIGNITSEHEWPVEFEPKDFRQHTRYADHIASKYRVLTVPRNFNLVDDFDDFMSYHTFFVGKAKDKRFQIDYFSDRIDVDKCAIDFENLMTIESAKVSGLDVAAVGSMMCASSLRQRFMNMPDEGVGAYKSVIRGWLGNGRLIHSHEIMRKIPKGMLADYGYNVASVVSFVLGHYAWYHPLYNLSENENTRLIKAAEIFFTKFNTDDFLNRGTELCDLKSHYKITPKGNDHCGSINMRLAEAAIVFGLEFGNQNIFDAGVRRLEVHLSTFNSDAVYGAQAARGRCSLAYMGQFLETHEVLAYVFDKAFSIDFRNTPNNNGVTPLDSYRKLWALYENPIEIEKYNKPDTSDNFCGRNGTYSEALKKLKNKDTRNSVLFEFRGALKQHTLLLQAPSTAEEVFPERFALAERLVSGQSGAGYVIDFVTVSPFVLGLATDRFDTSLDVSFKRRYNTVFLGLDEFQKHNLPPYQLPSDVRLFSGKLRCKVEATGADTDGAAKRFFSGYAYIENGVMELKLKLTGDDREKWREIRSGANLLVLANGAIVGRLPFHLWGGHYEVFEFNSDSSETKGGPEGYHNTKGQLASLKIQIADCV